MRTILNLILITVTIHFQGTVKGQQTESTQGVDADPTATILGSVTDVCLGDSVEAYLFFTGNGPWDAIINDDDGEYLKLKDVETPYTIWLKPETDNRYYIDYVEDRKRNDGKTFGEVRLSVHEITPASIEMDRTAYLKTESGVPLLGSPLWGVFSGPGVSGFLFYPGIATPEGSPHRITYTYTNQYGCKSSDRINLHVLHGEGEVLLLSGNDTISELCDDGETYVIRGSNLDNIPGLFELREVGSPDPVSGHITDEDLKDDMAHFNPTGLAGNYEIIYTYTFQDLTIRIPFRFQVNDLGTIEIPGLPGLVCKNDDPYPLVPQLSENDPGAVYQFSGPGVSGNQSDGYFYDPGDPEAPVGKNQITLEYTASNGCSSRLITTVINRFVPDVQFSLSPICLPEDGGLVSFENLTSGKHAVDSWSWDFGDPSSGANNYSNFENPGHFYEEAGSRQITLTATTDEGCEGIHTLDTVLLDQPMADFSWNNDCFIRGQEIGFVDRSVSEFSSLDTFIWTFKTSNNGVLGVVGSNSSSDTVEFSFANLDSYLIDLKVRSQAGCEGNTTKEIVLKPTRVLTSTGYEEGFNGASTDWISGSDDENLSWIRNVPDFDGFNQVPGDLAWYTYLPRSNSEYLENSWIESTCFDFSGSTNPVFKMDLMKSFAPNLDGAVLQYQHVVSDGWKTIGNVGEGIKWYNLTEIENKPGGNNFGWGMEIFNPDTKWVNASHDLAMLAGRTHVKFRIAIATGASKEVQLGRYNQGFAFDNIFIGDPVRRSLLEYFTNSSSMECRDADDMVDHFAIKHSDRVIDLQYHVDFPGVDPMNENNPYPPSTRSFNYGVQAVPYALFNGGTIPGHRFDFSDPFNEPNDELLLQASLEIPVFNMDLTVHWLETSLEATTSVTCNTNTFFSNLQLYVVPIETSVTAFPGLNQDTVFRNVVLDILPTPAGKLLGNEWYSGKTDSRTYSWDYPQYVEDLKDLAVVSFVQDRDNGQVLQVAIKYHTPQVGFTTASGETHSMTIYPNPAIDWINVNLGLLTENGGQIVIMDLSGKVVLTKDVESGLNKYRLNVAHLSRGMYMIYWVISGEVKGRNKIVLYR